MIVVMLTTSAIVVVVFSLLGTVGNYHVESPLERIAYGALYTSLCLPGFYALQVVVLYFLRFWKPIGILAGLAFAALLGSFQCSAMMHTIESLTRPAYPVEAGFLRLYFVVATSALSCQILYFYLVRQRVRHRPPVAVPSGTGRDAPAAARDANEAATASEGEDLNGKEPSNPGDVSPTVAVQDESADSRGHPNRQEPAAEQANPDTQQLAAYRPAGKPGALLKLLPDRLGTDLIYIKSEDHYLEVHTTVGSSLVKMRFSAALAARRARHPGPSQLLGRDKPCDQIGEERQAHAAAPHGRPQGASKRDPPARRARHPRPPHTHRRRMNLCSRNAQIIGDLEVGAVISLVLRR